MLNQKSSEVTSDGDTLVNCEWGKDKREKKSLIKKKRKKNCEILLMCDENRKEIGSDWIEKPEKKNIKKIQIFENQADIIVSPSSIRARNFVFWSFVCCALNFMNMSGL